MRRLFWAKEGVKFAGTVVAASGIYAFLMAAMNGPVNTLQENINLGVLYLAMFGSIMSQMFNIAAYQTVVPLALSFGGTRKEVVLGIHIYRLAIILPLVIVVAVVTMLTTSAMRYQLLVIVVLMVAAFLFFSGLGATIGSLQSKLGKTALSVISAVSVLGGMVLFGLCVFLLYAVFEKGILWFSLGFGALVYTVCSVFEYRAIKSYCVK